MKKTDFDINGFILKREIPWTLYGVSSCKKKNIKAQKGFDDSVLIFSFYILKTSFVKSLWCLFLDVYW